MTDNWTTRQQVEALQKRRQRINPITEHLRVATREFDSIDEMSELITAKLQGHPDGLQLWAVDSTDPHSEGWTICITGNGPHSEHNAEWIALLLTHGDGLIERCLWLEEQLVTMDARLREEAAS